ncbi:MAG: nucleotide exchange factor GrpE [Coxiella sp. (in: Bacteria)]|nr:MAG: nucleotide exchange factor GrpE [Coxiella sp. (in: g-proteobacteria)]
MSKKKSEDPKEKKWQEFAERIPEDAADEPIFEDEPVAEAADKGDNGPSHEALEQELNALEMKLAEYKDTAIRAKAEADNVRRRAERDVQNAHKFGTEKLLTDLLPVVDSVVRGMEGMSADDPGREGMALTLSLLEKTLEKHGVKVIHPELGEAFNPDKHEAVTMQAAPDAESNTILQVLQNGYELNGRVVRAAMVIVAN